MNETEQKKNLSRTDILRQLIEVRAKLELIVGNLVDARTGKVSTDIAIAGSIVKINSVLTMLERISGRV